MAPAFGNKHAVGYGRPPNQGFSDEEIIALGEELLEWCAEADKTKEEIVHLSQFYSEKKGISRSQWRALEHRECFNPYYEKARAWMGKKILLNSRLPTAYGSRFLGIYFTEVRDYEMSVVEHKVDYEAKKRGSQPQCTINLTTLTQDIAAGKYTIEQQQTIIPQLTSDSIERDEAAIYKDGDSANGEPAQIEHNE